MNQNFNDTVPMSLIWLIGTVVAVAVLMALVPAIVWFIGDTTRQMMYINPRR